ncbi:Endoglucanase/exoglucanase B [Gossypium arboreum]|uniref:Endoglucanase/exoglucanase B n=1 Tax=Gossypium arboreum TaxID=29729 RepID=A0A0B0NL08_GOSAR|nr:Endoglucanase/exoglucanase B [Gossypium arboreum]
MILFFMVVESCAKVYFQPRSHRYNPSVHIHPSFRRAFTKQMLLCLRSRLTPPTRFCDQYEPSTPQTTHASR